jgi:prepilin-type N-terminal cleavage/methylation domain-containing protein
MEGRRGPRQRPAQPYPAGTVTTVRSVSPSLGFTLVEVLVVVALAGVVSLGLVAFYLSSQATWMDASSQALSQRDATAVVDVIAARARTATSAAINVTPDTVLTFYGPGGTDPYSFWRSSTDSLLHQGHGDGAVDEGPVASSLVEQFSVSLDGALPLVHLTALQVRSETGERVRMQSTFQLYNAP